MVKLKIVKATNYYKEHQLKNEIELREKLKTLPHFCLNFFIGIEHRSSVLTRLGYREDLVVFFTYLIVEEYDFNQHKTILDLKIDDLKKINAQHLERFLSYLSAYNQTGKMQTNSKTTKARKLSAVRGLLSYYFNNGVLDSNVGTRVLMPKKEDKEIIRLEIDEVVRLLNSSEDGDVLTSKEKDYHNITKTRDTALLSLLLGTGIRISEMVGLNVTDIDFSNNAFVVTRKGGGRSTLYFNDEIRSELLLWLKDREKILGKELRKHKYTDAKKFIKKTVTDTQDIKNLERAKELIEEPALFISLQKKRITPRAVLNLVKKYTSRVAPLKNITPHKLRTTFGTNLYKEIGDIYAVAEVLGHKDVNTTRKHYAAQSEEIKRAALNSVKLRDKN